MASRAKKPSALYMEQAQEAHELVLGGMGYRQIADKMGVSLGTVQNRLKLYREEISAPRLEDLRNRQLARIEMGIRALWPMYLKADKDAINGMVALMKREADLLGLNAATAFKVEATISTRETDANEAQKIMDHFFGRDTQPANKTIPGEVVSSEGYTRPRRPLKESEPITYASTPADEFRNDDAFQPHEVHKEAVHIAEDIEEPAPRPKKRRTPPNPSLQFLVDNDD
ncbi:sigma factor-like helix-turn-helix DNA-binding protein [Streptomyces sp. NPDC059166]|uniref:sigma factor-like helix-turn-helix DNA-binding protein n=1 Tax=Streptomyces sp. NPDC059166 TaxID=3346752 RepID=UPI0036B120AD